MYEGWYIKHMENKHPGCAFAVVPQGKGKDKNDHDKRGKIKLLMFCVAKNIF